MKNGVILQIIRVLDVTPPESFLHLVRPDDVAISPWAHGTTIFPNGDA